MKREVLFPIIFITLIGIIIWGCYKTDKTSALLTIMGASEMETTETNYAEKESSKKKKNYKEGKDWPQFLGPNRNNTSDEKGILRTWPKDGPEVLWTTTVQKGYGGPVIKDDKVYLLDRDGKKGDIMRCFDLNNGKELWKYSYNSPGTVSYPGSRSVPIVDDKYVYSCGQNGDLYCIDLKKHKPVWNTNIWTKYGGKRIPSWGITQNPLIYDKMLIVASQAPEAGVIAYNKKTGKVIWKTSNLGRISYASPSVVKIHGEDHIVMVKSSSRRGGGNVVGIEPKTGKIKWKFDKWKCRISVPNAYDAGKNKLLILGGYDLGAMMIEITKKEDGSFGAKELYRTVEFGDQTKPPIYHDGYFYAQYGTNSRRDGLACMNSDGKIMWKTKRSPSFDKGSMILVDGLILATDGSKKLYLIEPNSTKFKELASAELLDRGQNWAPIALSGGKLLIRDQSKLKCVKVSK